MVHVLENMRLLTPFLAKPAIRENPTNHFPFKYEVKFHYPLKTETSLLELAQFFGDLDFKNYSYTIGVKQNPIILEIVLRKHDGLIVIGGEQLPQKKYLSLFTQLNRCDLQAQFDSLPKAVKLDFFEDFHLNKHFG